MIQRLPKALFASAAILAAASLGGCATKKYVAETVDSHVAPVAARVAQHDTQLASLDQRTNDALQRADAAGKLAEGKFVYSEVLSDDSVKFPRAKATLTPEAMARLDAFASKLKSDNRNVYVEIQGYADPGETKAKAVALRLGNERAEAVKRYLNKQGVPLNRIATISYGSEDVTPATDAQGHQANRRVVLVVMA